MVFNPAAESPASQQVIAAYIASRLSQYRRLDTLVPFADVEGLTDFLTNYRLLTSNACNQVLYLDSPGVFLDQKTKLDSLQPKKEATTLVQQDILTFITPQKLVRMRRITQNSVRLDTHVMYAPY